MIDSPLTRLGRTNRMLSGCFALAFVALYVWGCAIPPTMQDAEEVPPEKGVVFGSVEVYADGEKQKWGIKLTGSKYFYLTILPPHTSEAITYKLAKDGVFYWSLPPGQYTLVGYHWQDLQTRRTGRIGATFSVPKSGVDAYLGTIEFRGNEIFLVPDFQDRFDQIIHAYETRFPGRQRAVVRRLFKPPQPVGNFSSVRAQCHEEWGIECTDRFSGVTPLSPEVTQSGFPTSSSLQPEFRWHSSDKSGISYDLILYDAAAYAVGGATIPSYMKGRVVAYVENLNEPYWCPETPLAPDTRYMWSVRLREGEMVSGWSTQGHFTFLIVAMSSGYGQWFQFSTP